MRTFRSILATFSAAIVVAGIRTMAFAAGLPQVPGAQEKAQQGGVTDAAASLTGSTGSALEPYLITFLLPVFGIIMIVMCVYVDRLMRRGAEAR